MQYAPQSLLNQPIHEADSLLRVLAKSHLRQVQTSEEKQLVKAVVSAWFNTHRKLLNGADALIIKGADDQYILLLECSERSTSRGRYKEIIKKLKIHLSKLRATLITASIKPVNQYDSVVIDFSKMISEKEMVAILNKRFGEIKVCLAGGAPMAATIMMGAMIEALLLARINSAAPRDKALAFKAAAAPKDKTGKTKQLSDWGLNDFIEVAHEMKWIRPAAKEISVVMRDYRNFIHPVKELTSRISIEALDADMFWVIFVQIIQQILKV